MAGVFSFCMHARWDEPPRIGRYTALRGYILCDKRTQWSSHNPVSSLWVLIWGISSATIAFLTEPARPDG